MQGRRRTDLGNMMKLSMPNLPEFSDENFNIARYIMASLVTLSGGFFIYEVLFNSNLVFSANWNIFMSPLGNICIFIGFFCAIIFWGKLGHWSRTPVVKYRDRYGNEVVEEHMDVNDQLFAKVLLPILGHFIFEPIIYGCLIYYPIQCVIALVGTIFPYVLSLIIIGIIVGSWSLTKNFNFRYHSTILVLMGLLFTGSFLWGGLALHNATPESDIQLFIDTPKSSDNVNNTFDDDKGEPTNIRQ